MDRKKRKKSNAGMSLLEVIVAVSIFSITATVLLQSFVTSQRINKKSNLYLEATTVAQNIMEEIKSKDFEDAIRNAVSLGGDTDTLGAITGSIAEAFYGIPAVLIAECRSRIDEGLMTDVLDEFDHTLGRDKNADSDEKKGKRLMEL